MKLSVKVDIVSDVVCPWCIVGYKRFQLAITDLKKDVDFEIEWHPFELNPQMETEGENLREHLMAKYGINLEQSIAARSNLTDLGLDLGFQFNFHDGMSIYNTFQAHQLLHWAKGKNNQTELKLALFDAYFTNRVNISDPQSLLEIVDKVGLNKVEAKLALDEETFAEDVRAKQQHWRSLGVQGVPAIILDNKYLISGAQEPAHFKQAIEQLLSEKEAA